MSLPSRERGLKYLKKQLPENLLTVAPLAGAWIEIFERPGATVSDQSLPSRERELKEITRC